MKEKLIPVVLATTIVLGAPSLTALAEENDNVEVSGTVESSEKGEKSKEKKNNEEKSTLDEGEVIADEKKSSDSSKVDIKAKSAILFDASKNKVIYNKNPDEVISTASLAKVMTLYIALDKIENGELELKDKVKISETAWKSKGSTMFLNIGAEITVEELIRGIAIVSGNDGATALGEHISGDVSSFVKLMNVQAEKLGMKNTNFLTPTGFGNEQGYDTSTANDLLILTKSYVERFEKYLKYHQELEFVTKKELNGGKNDIPQKATNGLLRNYKGTLGLKTGWVEDAYNLIGVSERQGIRMISVVLASDSSPNRENDTENLFEHGYSKYKVYTISEKGSKLDTLPVYKAGEFSKVDIIVKKDVKITIHEDEKGKGDITETLNIPKHVLGGVKKGDVIGFKAIKLNGKEIAKVEYTVAEDVPVGSFMNRTKDSIFLTFEWMKNKF